MMRVQVDVIYAHVGAFPFVGRFTSGEAWYYMAYVIVAEERGGEFYLILRKIMFVTVEGSEVCLSLDCLWQS